MVKTAKKPQQLKKWKNSTPAEKVGFVAAIIIVGLVLSVLTTLVVKLIQVIIGV